MVYSVGRRTFDRLVAYLQPCPIFHSSGWKPQRPVRFQLACYLLRYGALGGDPRTVAHKMGVSLGAVFLYCRRVTRAFRQLGYRRVVVWPNQARRAESKADFGENGFDECIGVVDGSLIRLTTIPKVQGALYFCRKRYPAVSIVISVPTQLLNLYS